MTLREILRSTEKWLNEIPLYIDDTFQYVGDGFQLVWRGDALDAEIPQLILPLLVLLFGAWFYWASLRYMWREHGRELANFKEWLDLPIKSKVYRLFELVMLIGFLVAITGIAFYHSPFFEWF